MRTILQHLKNDVSLSHWNQWDFKAPGARARTEAFENWHHVANVEGRLGPTAACGENIAGQMTKDSVARLSTRLSGTALASSEEEVQSRPLAIEKEAELPSQQELKRRAEGEGNSANTITSRAKRSKRVRRLYR
jgi:hypothetical protein